MEHLSLYLSREERQTPMAACVSTRKGFRVQVRKKGEFKCTVRKGPTDQQHAVLFLFLWNEPRDREEGRALSLTSSSDLLR